MLERKWKNELVRFNAEYGPESLFERVQFKMKDVHTLHTSGPHFNARINERNIPAAVLDKVYHFNTAEWKLVAAEVRADRGKFYNSTWEYLYNGCAYWLTIGIGECVVTIVRKDAHGPGIGVQSGDFYDFVEEVNRKLMDNEI